MSAAIKAVELRVEAARRLTASLQANGTAEALRAVLPLRRTIPYDMLKLLCELDAEDRDND